jgi:hypothetical protein
MDEELPEHCSVEIPLFLILYGEGVILRKITVFPVLSFSISSLGKLDYYSAIKE